MAPWPGISPYETNYSQTYNEGGLWHSDTNNLPQRHFFTIEALISRTKKPEENFVGSPEAPAMPGNVFPRINLGAFTSGVVGTAEIDSLGVFEDREKDPSSPGIRAVWGFLNPDDSGLEISGYWASDVGWLFRRGADSDLHEPEATRITAGLPLDDGGEGSTVPYDELFKITHDAESFGAKLTWLMTPKWKREYFSLRPVWGLRYLFIRERFTFDGKDSGLAMTFFPDGTPDLETDPISIVDPYHAYLQSGVRSHIVGPQVGLRYELGREKLKIWGESIFGIMANRESIDLSGNGIGDPYGQNFEQDSPFAEHQVHTHVSPLLEQSVNLEMKVFSLLPLMRKLYILENAKLRVGYSITGLWEVARPAASINWQGLPLYPQISVDREKWYIQSWHFGMHWNY